MHKITTIKLVLCILKYESNVLLDYDVCKSNGYLSNMKKIINDKNVVSSNMMKTVNELTTAYKKWTKDTN